MRRPVFSDKKIPLHYTLCALCCLALFSHAQPAFGAAVVAPKQTSTTLSDADKALQRFAETYNKGDYACYTGMYIV